MDRWGSTEHLLAAAVDALNGANWQRAGDKRASKPAPVPRPDRAARAPRRGLTPEQAREAFGF